MSAFVREVLAWDAQVARVERSARGGASPLVAVVASLELGVLGSGCRGTKGVMVGNPHADRAAPAVDPRLEARYRALRGEDLRTADAVVLDGHGERELELAVGARRVRCTLAQRLGLQLADEHQQLLWLAKIGQGDSRPALEGAHQLAQPRLDAAAAAWLAVVVES